MNATRNSVPPRSSRRFALDSSAARLTAAERAERGKTARSAVPRDSHAAYDPPADRPDPVGLLERQAATRLPDLVPVRYGRMLASPFSYFRGAALSMAADLAATPVSGLAVQACGDAHLVQLRRLRIARTCPGLRPQRLRRDAAGTLGVGRQAAGGQPGGGRARQRLPVRAAPQGGDRGSRPVSRGDAQFSPDRATWPSGTPERKPGLCASSSGLSSPPVSSDRRTRPWPRRGPGTACRRWPS